MTTRLEPLSRLERPALRAQVVRTIAIALCAITLIDALETRDARAQQTTRTVDVVGALRPADADAAAALRGAEVRVATYELATQQYVDFAPLTTVGDDGTFRAPLALPAGDTDVLLVVDAGDVPHLAYTTVAAGDAQIDVTLDIYAGEPGPGACELLGELINVETFELNGVTYLNIQWYWLIGNPGSRAQFAGDGAGPLVQVIAAEPPGSSRPLPARTDGRRQPLAPAGAQTQPALRPWTAEELASVANPLSRVPELIPPVDVFAEDATLAIATPLLPGLTAVQANDIVRIADGNAGELRRALGVPVAAGAQTVVRLQPGTILAPERLADVTDLGTSQDAGFATFAWAAEQVQAFALIVEEPGPSPMGGGDGASNGGGMGANGAMPGMPASMGGEGADPPTDDTDRSLPGFPWFVTVAGACVVWVFVVMVARVRRRESPDIADPTAIDTARLQQLVRDLHAKPETFGLAADELSRAREATVSELARRHAAAR